ncbi:hypothetical protein INT48_000203 [Thamnidium elegans]|uniref:BHLH domain-containing protein n=1 Tax=Thamnidium elegans TaxID=101142 RepID=A0A8H7W1N0_9FUNG|nr:hypothetical protein INT48_000203 [Thamnidium elegans]
MYSPTQQDYNLESDHFTNQGMSGTPHTTVGAVPVVQRNNNRLFNPSQYHQRQNSFGTVASAMSPPSHRNAGMAFSNDNNQQNWFGTSMDSNGSSFGQSPIFHGNNRDLIVSPSTSTSHLDGFTGNEDDEGQQRNLQEMFEKRQLCTLLPERLLDSAPTSSNVMSVSSGQVGANGRAINKGTILKLSVDHIKELREDVGRYQERIRELEQMIESAKRGEMIIDSNTRSNSGHQRVGSIQFRQQFNNLQID